MEGRQEPNAQPEEKQDSNDEEIIDLTQIVATGDDDEIIDLTEILEQPDQPYAAAEAPEGPIVPHLDDAENAAISDEIVELTDIAPPESTAAQGTEWDDLDSALDESFGDLSDLDEESNADALVIDAPEDVSDEGELPPNVNDASDGSTAIAADPAESSDEYTASQREEKDEEPIDLGDVDDPNPATMEAIGLDEFDNALEDAFGDLTDSDTEAGMDVVAIDTPQEALEAGDAEDEFVASEVDAGIPDGDDLTAAEDDEIIDLLDITATSEADIAEAPAEGAVSQPVKAESADEDEEIIDLLDIAATPEADTAAAPVEGVVSQPAEAEATDEDEEVIDLLDIAATPEADTAAAPVEGAVSQPAEAETADEDEEVIDLLDTAAIGTPEQNAETPMPPEESQDVIDLMDVVEPGQNVSGVVDRPAFDAAPDAGPAAPENAEPSMDSAPEDMETPEEAAETAGPDDDLMVLGMDGAADETTATPFADVEEQEAALDFAETSAQARVISAVAGSEYAAEPSATLTPAAPSDSESISVTDAQLEAALEKVIEKIYGQKIEQLLIQAIERTVKREIEKIKSTLLENG